MTRPPRPYLNPYLAGVGLGLVLLLSFYATGHGLSGSNAFERAAAATAHGLAPQATESNAQFARYYPAGASESPLWSWTVFQIVGVALGGFVSGLIGRRIKREVVRGPRVSVALRLTSALAGGVIVGFATRWSRGCTSGLALSQGSLLSPGAWVFMFAVFGGGYAIAYFARRLWT